MLCYLDFGDRLDTLDVLSGFLGAGTPHNHEQLYTPFKTTEGVFKMGHLLVALAADKNWRTLAVS